MEKDDMMKLENQVCFPLYAASRLVTRMYQPLLEKLDITYPQYLILLVLWEKDAIPVKEIGEKLLLETNTLTPLLKRMEAKGILSRVRSEEDERKVVITLTESGKVMKEEALCIPGELLNGMPESYSVEKLIQLREDLKELIFLLK
jgi:MarR family transcriptional regulator, organic hydroperoxide resistance regulator